MNKKNYAMLLAPISPICAAWACVVLELSETEGVEPRPLPFEELKTFLKGHVRTSEYMQSPYIPYSEVVDVFSYFGDVNNVETHTIAPDGKGGIVVNFSTKDGDESL